MRYTLMVLGLSGVVSVAGCSGTGSPAVATHVLNSTQTVDGDVPALSTLATGAVSAVRTPPWPHSSTPLRQNVVSDARVDGGLKCPPDRIYVADFQASLIDVYPLHRPLRPKPCGYITQGVFGPSGISVGQDGTLYVSDYTFSLVTEYRRNSSKAFRKISVASKPQYAYGGADGTLYVSESYANQIEEFAPGAKTPTLTISVTYPWGVATDSANNLYVTSDICTSSTCVGHILEFPPGSTTGTDLGIMIGFEFGITIAKDNSIVVGDGGNVDVFPPGATTPIRSFAAVDPFQIALDQNERRLFVATDRPGTVGIYDFKTGALLETMTNFTEPDGVALDPPAPY
jgi:DNA-binding beta-propeller fold protein YncE